ncbi:RsmE family RNA methyltransferase, partial [Thiohalospira sp.]|uniref:RsmE family RNA methyltransferase n=1 Tax=Thiohalospira sp. TaxID=3080549 RepID=UPI0039803858
MPTPRIHVPGPLEAGSEIDLPEGAVRHLGRVLRLRAGATVTLFDGRGGEYTATLTALDKRSGAARVEAFDPVERESPLALELVQGVAKGERMDFAIQKAVELGVTRIVPVLTERGTFVVNGAERFI